MNLPCASVWVSGLGPGQRELNAMNKVILQQSLIPKYRFSMSVPINLFAGVLVSHCLYSKWIVSHELIKALYMV